MLLESPDLFLPKFPLYLDDSNQPDHNIFCGELLAVEEFNAKSSHRKIAPMRQLRNWRIFKNALWLDQMFFVHIFDSLYRTPELIEEKMLLSCIIPIFKVSVKLS